MLHGALAWTATTALLLVLAAFLPADDRIEASISPVLALYALHAAVVLGSLTRGGVEEYEKTASRALPAWRSLSIGIALVAIAATGTLIVLALGDVWFTPSLVQAATFSIAATTVLSRFVGTRSAVIAVCVYAAIGFFGTANTWWNMIVHDQDPARLTAAVITAALGCVAVALRGSKPLKPHDDTLS